MRFVEQANARRLPLHPFRYLQAHRYVRNTVLMVAVILIVLPAALSDGHERHAQKPDREVAYVFKGSFHAAASTLSVVRGNRHVRRAGLVGQDVAFDLSSARVRVADVNGDGMRNAADLQEGDTVVVKAFAPRRTPGAGRFVAHKVVDQSHGREHVRGHGGREHR
jgi:hypothetical protein